MSFALVVSALVLSLAIVIGLSTILALEVIYQGERGDPGTRGPIGNLEPFTPASVVPFIFSSPFFAMAGPNALFYYNSKEKLVTASFVMTVKTITMFPGDGYLRIGTYPLSPVSGSTMIGQAYNMVQKGGASVMYNTSQSINIGVFIEDQWFQNDLINVNITFILP